ncbi:MAG: HD domain-containing protein [Eubacteriales bacterium]|nr:HD domain-containing protein [Eubacteriales bacterium]MDD4476058.1 HD domain-containing protein [Eubacteriales bacterium]
MYNSVERNPVSGSDATGISQNLKLVVCFTLALLLMLGILAVYINLIHNDYIVLGDGEIIDDWEYTTGYSIVDINNSSIAYKKVKSLSEIKTSTNYDFIRLKKKVDSKDKIGYLNINTYFNQINVEINGGLVYNSIDSLTKFATELYINVEVPKSSDDIEIVVTVRAAFTPKIDIFALGSKSTSLSLSNVLVKTTVLSAITGILSLIAVAVGILSTKERFKTKLIGVGISGFLFFVFSFIYTLMFYTNINSLVLFRVCFALAMTASFIQAYYSSRLAASGTTVMQFFSAVGILYITVFALSSREEFFIFLLKNYIFYLLAFYIATTIVHIRQKPKLNSWIYITSFIALSLSVVSFWISFSINTSYHLVIVALAFYIIHTIACFINYIFSFKKGKKAKTEKTVAETDGVMFNFNPYDLMKELGSVGELFELILSVPHNYAHVRNVSYYVYAICYHHGYTVDECKKTAKASLLHDIGKLMVPNSIRNKFDTLTSEEFEEMKKHTQYGYEILSSGSSELMKTGATIARQHHERYDGNGYFGIKGEEINEFAQITCIADVFDAITSERKYKKAWSFNDGFNYILNHAGTYFSPVFIESFKKSKDDISSIYNKTREK